MGIHHIIRLICIMLAVSGLAAADTVYVDCDNTVGPWDGSPDYPYQNIQDGIDVALDTDVVMVSEGTYTGTDNRDLNFMGKALSLRSDSGADITIIDCEFSGRGFILTNGETNNAVIDGFTIRNGYVDKGGGIFFEDSSLTIESAPTITNCTITGNTASEWGGGIGCYISNTQIEECTITENSAVLQGGNIFVANGDTDIRDCILTDGNAKIGGGIYLNESGSLEITNCLITGNYSTNGGGGLLCNNSSNPSVSNCTIAGNSSYYWSGGVHCQNNSSPQYMNCILRGNSSSQISIQSGNPTFNYCNIEGGWTGPGGDNIDDDPLFVSGPLHEYYLGQTAAGQPSDSPSVNTGSDTAADLDLDELTTRTDSMPDTGIIDMGYHAPYILVIDAITNSEDNIIIHWNALDGISYIVELSDDRQAWNGTTVGQVTEWTDVGGAFHSSRYYRVREE